MESIHLLELPFDLPKIFHRAKVDEITIKRLKGEFNDYFYITSPNIHQQYSYNSEPILLAEISLGDLVEALNNPSFKKRVTEYIETTETVESF